MEFKTKLDPEGNAVFFTLKLRGNVATETQDKISQM